MSAAAAIAAVMLPAEAPAMTLILTWCPGMDQDFGSGLVVR